MKRIKVFGSFLLVLMIAFQCMAFAEPGWMENEGIKVLCDNEGNPVSGWYLESNHWYYMNERGEMTIGDFVVEDGCYTTDENGSITAGCVKISDVWYILQVAAETEEAEQEATKLVYLDVKDDKEAEETVIGEKTIKAVNDKEPLTGWILAEEEKVYYFNEDGTLDTGWKEIDGEMYFFMPDGHFATGEKYIDGETVMFSEAGTKMEEAEEETEAPQETEEEERTEENPDGEAPEASDTPAEQEEENAEDGEEELSEGQEEITEPEEEDLSDEELQEAEEEEEPDEESIQDEDEPGEITDEAEEPAEEAEEETTEPEIITQIPVEDEEPDEEDAPVETVKTITVSEAIPYETKRKNDNNRYEDDGTKVVQKGEDGEKKVTYEITLNEDGEEISRKAVNEEIVKEPVDKIISVPKKKHEIEVREETVQEAIPYETEIQNDTSRVKGEPNQVAQEGVDGVKEITYSVTYTDGTETGRTVKSQKVAKAPVKKIINVAIGEKVEYTTSHITRVEEIPFTTVNEDSGEIVKGESVVAQKGVNGEKEIVYAIKKDLEGKVISETVVSEKVTKEMRPQIIKNGTKELPAENQGTEESSETPSEGFTN